MASHNSTPIARRCLAKSCAAVILLAQGFTGLAPAFAQALLGKAVQETERQVLGPSDFQLKGAGLRKAIDERYKELSEAGALKSVGNGRNFITEIVVPYIPIGTPFADAEATLRAAGFDVGPRKNNSVFPNYFRVAAAIDHYVPTFFGKTSVFVYLEPPSSTDWTTVRALTAEITKQSI